jgi:hypothetical protein
LSKCSCDQGRNSVLRFPDNTILIVLCQKLGGTIKWISIRLLDNFLMNFMWKKNQIILSGKNKVELNDQGKDQGTIIVTAQLNLNMNWSLNW